MKIGAIIIGAAMLYGLIYLINQERYDNGKEALGCLATFIISIIVIIIWIALSYI